MSPISWDRLDLWILAPGKAECPAEGSWESGGLDPGLSASTLMLGMRKVSETGEQKQQRLFLLSCRSLRSHPRQSFWFSSRDRPRSEGHY